MGTQQWVEAMAAGGVTLFGSAPRCRVVVTVEPLDGSPGTRLVFPVTEDITIEIDEHYPDDPDDQSPYLPGRRRRSMQAKVSLTAAPGADGVTCTIEAIGPFEPGGGA